MDFSAITLPQIAAFSVFLGLVVFVAEGFLNPLSGVPGPWYTRWTGLVRRYMSMKSRGPTYIHELHKKYGPVVRIGPNWVDSMNPEDAQIIHRIKNPFPKSSWYVIKGITNVFSVQDVGVHGRWRRLLSGPLSESSLGEVLPQVESKVRFAIHQIGEEMKTRGAADVYKWWMCMTSDVIGELTFGESFQMLQTGKKNDFLRDIESTGPLAAVLRMFPWLSSGYIPTALLPYPLSEAVKLTGRIRAYAGKMLDKYAERLEKDSGAAPTLFTKIIKAGDENALSRSELLDNAELYIIAGSDTTSNTLTYLIWQICRHPQMKERLVKEVKALPDDFTPQQLKDLPYLNQVISETLRLHSAAPAGLPRVVPAGGATIGGHFLPSGVTAVTQAYSLHRNERVFPEPDKYDPDRWANPTKEMKDAFLPFGGGSRTCLGIHLAYHELRLATTLFWRTFPNATVSTKEGMCDKDMEMALFFLMSPKSHRCLIQAS